MSSFFSTPGGVVRLYHELLEIKRGTTFCWIQGMGKDVPRAQRITPLLREIPKTQPGISRGYLWVSYPQESLGNTINTVRVHVR